MKTIRNQDNVLKISSEYAAVAKKFVSSIDSIQIGSMDENGQVYNTQLFVNAVRTEITLIDMSYQKYLAGLSESEILEFWLKLRSKFGFDANEWIKED